MYEYVWLQVSNSIYSLQERKEMDFGWDQKYFSLFDIQRREHRDVESELGNVFLFHCVHNYLHCWWLRGSWPSLDDWPERSGVQHLCELWPDVSVMYDDACGVFLVRRFCITLTLLPSLTGANVGSHCSRHLAQWKSRKRWMRWDMRLIGLSVSGGRS